MWNIYDKMKSELMVLAYSAPEPKYTCDGLTYNTKITPYHFDMMKDLGVNLIFGKNYVDSKKDVRELYISLELASEREIGYLIALQVFREFVAVGGAYKPFWELNATEKTDLGKRFIAELKAFEAYPAFVGIAFYDEPAENMFEGIAYAKKLFEQAYPEKLFFVNMYGYFITAKQYQGRADNIDKRFKQSKEISYTNFMSDYLNKCKPKIYSYDLYPIITLNGYETNIHKALYEQFCLIKEHLKKDDIQIPIWSFIQAGGKWENSLNTRVPKYSEIALQINVLLALGAKGLEIFPYCLPDCWSDDSNVDAGLLDKFGNYTDMYYYFKRALRQAKACRQVFLQSENLGYMLVGKYENMLDSEQEILKLPDGECMYNGAFNSSGALANFYPIQSVETSSQLLIGCFKNDTQRCLFIVNNSTTTSVIATLNFSEKVNYKTIQNGNQQNGSGDSFKIRCLDSGEAIMLII